jgi:hypothetical protein
MRTGAKAVVAVDGSAYARRCFAVTDTCASRAAALVW